MESKLIHDRGRGPEIDGTRITVYNLLPHFLDPTATESFICQIYDITPEQVAAARAYILNNPDTILAQHLKIEERMAAGNPPQVIEQAKKTHEAFLNFKARLAECEQNGETGQPAEPTSASDKNGSGQFPTFREWLAEQKTRPGEGS